VAAGNLLQALDLPPKTTVSIDRTIAEGLKEGRDLHKHWPENMPVFNGTPRPRQPGYPSGKRFAARNLRAGPYSPGFTGKAGALLMPHVPALALHEILDAVEAEVLASDESLARFVQSRAPSPWVKDEYGWWPKGENA
jgi:hypothetical protein